MPHATASDGVRLYWEERGSGPTVLLTPYWAMHPSVFDSIEAVLEGEFRVVRFDERGTGQSDRVGPYDMGTGVSDLETVCEAVGGVAAAVCLVDAANRAVRVADTRPELVDVVICIGSAPFGVGALRNSDSLLASEAVVGAYLQQLEADYRGAVRAALSGANTQLDEEQVKERVQIQMEYIDAEAASMRARAWAGDSEAVEPANRIGDRMHICLSETLGGSGTWFPSAAELVAVANELFPDAGQSFVPDGIVSAPEESAAVVAEVIARRQAEISAGAGPLSSA